MATKENLRTLREKEKKLYEKLKEIKKKKKELIKLKLYERILNDTLLKYAIPISYFLYYYDFPLEPNLEIELYGGNYTKAFLLLSFIYKCNRGKAVKNPCGCLSRLLKELRSLEGSRFEILDERLTKYLEYITEDLCKENPELIFKAQEELSKIKPIKRMPYILDVLKEIEEAEKEDEEFQDLP